jgi:hypothetical protein
MMRKVQRRIWRRKRKPHRWRREEDKGEVMEKRRAAEGRRSTKEREKRRKK